MSATQDKPLPTVTDMTRPFWEGAHDGRLMMQKCRHCQTVNFHPKPWCIECASRDLVWTEMKPAGIVYSYTVSHAVAMNHMGWKDDLPVILALVDIDDGARMYAQVTHAAPADMKIGMRVTAHFETIADGIGIPKFRPE
ncbi:MAG: Zn-ribbon domain-containing OB-fold protein [Mesorhizobium sp.]